MATEDEVPPPSAEAAAQAAAEAIPLPWFLKKPLLRAFARDSHHYLFNVDHSPRSGETYSVRDEIRRRFVSIVAEAAGSGPVVLLTHSMGTVIAYDCLKNVDECSNVEDFITVGSPLGLSEMQDKLDPGYSRADGYPGKVKRRWVNIYDPVDIVSRADPKIANEYKQDGVEALTDLRQNNGGLWTHSMVRYAAKAPLRSVLRTMLE